MDKLTSYEFGRFLMDESKLSISMEDQDYKNVYMITKVPRADQCYVLYVGNIWGNTRWEHEVITRPFGYWFRKQKLFVHWDTYYSSKVCEIPENKKLDDIEYMEASVFWKQIVATLQDYMKSIDDDMNITDFEGEEWRIDRLMHDARVDYIICGFEAAKNKISNDYLDCSGRVSTTDYPLYMSNPDEFCKTMLERQLEFFGYDLKENKWSRKLRLNYLEELVKDKELQAKKRFYDVLVAFDAKTYTTYIVDDSGNEFEFKLPADDLKRLITGQEECLPHWRLSGPAEKAWDRKNYGEHIRWHNIKELKYRNKTIWKRDE